MAGRKPIGRKAMTATERQQRRRTRLKKEAERAAKLEKGRVKRERRAQQEAELAAATIKASQAIGSELYGVLYVDPPWRFEPYSRETGMDRAADNHYPTMTLDQIKALKVPAAPDCVLLMWATAPMLPQALSVIDAWGFQYKTHYIWAKTSIGTGYWNRNAHEILLVATRGNVPAPAPGTQYASVITASATEHSAKPAIFAEMI